MPQGKCGEAAAFELTFAEFGCQGAISGRENKPRKRPLCGHYWPSHRHYRLTKVEPVETGGMYEKQADKVIYRTFGNIAQSFGL